MTVHGDSHTQHGCSRRYRQGTGSNLHMSTGSLLTFALLLAAAQGRSRLVHRPTLHAASLPLRLRASIYSSESLPDEVADPASDEGPTHSRRTLLDATGLASIAFYLGGLMSQMTESQVVSAVPVTSLHPSPSKLASPDLGSHDMLGLAGVSSSTESAGTFKFPWRAVAAASSIAYVLGVICAPVVAPLEPEPSVEVDTVSNSATATTLEQNLLFEAPPVELVESTDDDVEIANVSMATVVSDSQPPTPSPDVRAMERRQLRIGLPMLRPREIRAILMLGLCAMIAIIWPRFGIIAVRITVTIARYSSRQ